MQKDVTETLSTEAGKLSLSLDPDTLRVVDVGD